MTNELLAPLEKENLASSDERPLTVREAAKFLGVSSQTVYLWVEKQVPISVSWAEISDF
jgi:predicted DNA-binding transcriptional regulator AlpA